jgi:Flp pilus assembly protein TadD
MNLPRTRRPLPLLLLVVSAATILGTAGCTTGGGRSGGAGVTGVSQLQEKGSALLKVADASRAAGDCNAALRIYHVAIAKGGGKETMVQARLGSGDCDLAMNNPAAAEQNYLAAAKLEPDLAAPKIGLGRVYLVEHHPNRAVANLDLAIKRGANQVFVWNDKGVALDQLRQHKEAQAAYRQGLTGHPHDVVLLNNLALSLAMTGDFNESESILRELASTPNANARIRDNLALVLGLEGKDAAARQVSAADLDGAALDNNTRFYQYARALLTGASVAAATADDNHNARSARTTRTARAAPPIPPPVLVMRTPKHPIKAAILAKPAPIQTAAIPPAAEPAPTLRKSTAGAVATLPTTAKPASDAGKPNSGATETLMPPAPLVPTETIAAAVPAPVPVASSNAQ